MRSRPEPLVDTSSTDTSAPPVMEGRPLVVDAAPPASDRIESPSVPDGPPPASEVERVLGDLLAELLGLDHVPTDRNVFEDLGADSMVMARLCARARRRGDVPPISIKDVYRHPTIRSLAAAVAEVDGGPRPAAPPPAAPVEAPAPGSTRQYLVCGALQLLFFLVYAYVAALGLAFGYDWISAGSGLGPIYLRAVGFSAAAFLVVAAVPIAAKWLLIGRWTPGRIRIWSLAYVRFWVVKTLIRANPCALLFVGSPLYSLYLKALGAGIGPGAVIFSRHVPVCTDLVTVGAGTVIRRDATFLGYRAVAGWIETGPVTIGREALVGERSVLDVETSLGNGAQLGHASALLSGQSVPDGERWHGCPAEPADVDYLRTPPARCARTRRVAFSVMTLVALWLVYLPLLEGGLDMLVAGTPSLGTFLAPSLQGGAQPAAVRSFFVAALILSLVLFAVLAVGGLVVVPVLSRVLNRFLVPGRVYPLFGFHDRVHRAIVRMGALRFLPRLFGDSSYIVPWFWLLGYRLAPVEQTGSNFGLTVTHANPSLSAVGTGTMVADGLAIVNDEVSSTSFRVRAASIGRHNFVGNDVTYPAGGRTGENCLLATKVMIPLDGEVREGVGLLGAPPFEIPRSVERDSRFDHLRSEDELRRRLPAKNRHNLRTIGLFLASRWFAVFLVTALVMAALELYGRYANVATALLFALSMVITAVYFALVERVVAGFRRLEPLYCSIYDPAFWRVERIWKVPGLEHLRVFDGTPFKNVVWRLAGVRVGRRVFDDGVYISERTLTAIGDDAVLNPYSKIMCHSQEDGTFKADRSTIGAACTVGVGALVHYGVTMGDGAVLAADSFLMKGEEIPAGARWGGNPAREM